jgi:hypothetical protein
MGNSTCSHVEKKDVETPRNTLRFLDMNPNSGGKSSTELPSKTSWKDAEKFKISEKILRKTNCRNGFSCLSADHTCLRDVEDNIADIVYFVKCTDKACPNWSPTDSWGLPVLAP